MTTTTTTTNELINGKQISTLRRLPRQARGKLLQMLQMLPMRPRQSQNQHHAATCSRQSSLANTQFRHHQPDYHKPASRLLHQLTGSRVRDRRGCWSCFMSQQVERRAHLLRRPLQVRLRQGGEISCCCILNLPPSSVIASTSAAGPSPAGFITCTLIL